MMIFTGHQEINMEVSEVIEGKIIDRLDKRFSKELVFLGRDGSYLKVTLVADDTKPLIPAMWEKKEDYDRRCELNEAGKK